MKQRIILIDYESIYEVFISESSNPKHILSTYTRASRKKKRDRKSKHFKYNLFEKSLDAHGLTPVYAIQREPDERTYLCHSADLYNNQGLLLFLNYDNIALWWTQAYPVLERIATITGTLVGTAAVIAAPYKFIQWVRSKLKSKGINEHDFLRKVLAKDSWNADELSTEINISKAQAKEMLRGFGYIWDAHKMLYIATENTIALRNL